MSLQGIGLSEKHKGAHLVGRLIQQCQSLVNLCQPLDVITPRDFIGYHHSKAALKNEEKWLNKDEW